MQRFAYKCVYNHIREKQKKNQIFENGRRIKQLQFIHVTVYYTVLKKMFTEKF